MLRDTDTPCQQSKTASGTKPSPPLSHINHPLNELLLNVRAILCKYDNKKDMLEKIQAAFDKKTNTIYNCTLNLWYKKYEQEADSKIKTEDKLNKTLEANRILTSKLNARPSLSFSAMMQKSTDTSNLPNPINPSEDGTPRSRVKSSNHLGFNLLDVQQFHNFSASEEVKDNLDPKECPLCQQSLHEVYEELRDCKARIESLTDTITRMNVKGQSLANQNTHLSSENSRLESFYKEAQSTIKFMEKHLTKLVTEHNEAKKKYLSQIEDKKLEIEVLIGKLHEYKAKSGKLGDKKVDSIEAATPKEIKSVTSLGTKLSTADAAKLVEENKHLQLEIYNLHKILMEYRSQQQNRGSTVPLEIPSSVYFGDEISKIVNQDDVVSRAGDDTIQHLKLLSRQVSSSVNQVCGQSTVANPPSQNPTAQASKQGQNAAPELKALNSSCKNMKVAGRENYAECTLI